MTSEMENVEHDDGAGLRPFVLRRYRDMPQAFVAKGLLDSAGIECFLQDDNVIRLDWLWSNAMGGIKLLVRQKDAEQAAQLLEENAGGGDEEAEAGWSSWEDKGEREG